MCGIAGHQLTPDALREITDPAGGVEYWARELESARLALDRHTPRERRGGWTAEELDAALERRETLVSRARPLRTCPPSHRQRHGELWQWPCSTPCGTRSDLRDARNVWLDPTNPRQPTFPCRHMRRDFVNSKDEEVCHEVPVRIDRCRISWE